eukprot:CAMPEP_0185191888 /NCGR_PEP_ID=MMETSP1140-20130426/17616_1 /TAXON_ID=298111 /ORGANISM="Pavlova sp., Strain CCMP459" /LENGTH=33 /DNA_ID= /DNA_START= /DNA_END= /DNA_ORIENTATION=
MTRRQRVVDCQREVGRETPPLQPSFSPLLLRLA